MKSFFTRFTTLRFRLLFLTLVIALPLSGLLLLQAYREMGREKQRIHETLQEHLAFAMREQEKLAESTRLLLSALAELPQIQPENAAACSALLAQLLAKQPAYANFGVVDAQGNLYCSAVLFTPPINFADRSWFQRAVSTQEFAAGDFLIGRVTGKPSLILAYPFPPKQTPRGVVYAALNLEWLKTMAAQLQLAEGDVYLLLDSQGTVLVRWPEEAEWLGRNLEGEPLIAQILGQNAPGELEATGLDGRRRFYAYAPLTAGQTRLGYLLVGRDRAASYGRVERSFYRSLLTSGVILALAVILSLSSAEAFFLRHIYDLMDAMHRLAGGDFHAHTRLPYGTSELSALRADFDALAARLEQQQQHLRLVLDHLPLILFAVDREGRFTYSDGHGLQALGLSPGEVIGRSAFEFYQAYPEVTANLQRALDGEEVVTVVRVDQRSFLASYLPLRDEQGKVTQVIGVGLDVSELQQLRRESSLFTLALLESSDAVFITDRAGVIQWVNLAFTALSGYAAEEAIGQTPRLLKSGMQDDEFYRQLWETILGGQLWRGELFNRRKDGTLFQVSQLILPVRDEKGEITHFVAIQRDITAEGRRQRLAEAKAMIAAALSEESEIAPLLERLLHAALHLVPAAEKGSILLWEADGQLHIRAVHGYHDPRALLSTFPLTSGYSAKAFRERRALLIPDVQADETIRYQGEITELAEIQSAIVAPLLSRQRALGVISLDNVSRKEAFTEADLEVLSELAAYIALALENISLTVQTRERLKRIEALREIDLAIIGTIDLRLMLDTLVRQVVRRLNVHAAGVWLYSREAYDLRFGRGEGFQYPGALVGKYLRLKEGLLGQAAFARRTLALHDTARSLDAPTLMSLFQGEGFRAAYAVPMISKGELVGVLGVFHREPAPYLQSGMDEREWSEFLEALAAQAAIAVENAMLYNETSRAAVEVEIAYDATIEGWARALEMRDYETHGHTRRVTEMTIALAEAMGLPSALMKHIRRGALLHDIGKMAIPDEILRKPGPLTEEEWTIMRQHPQIAYNLLANVDFLKLALDIPYCHHEKWDGTGYPRGLQGDLIPLAARIFAVVDVWDALTTNRPYRKAFSTSDALAYIRAQSGKHFDPKVVQAFEQLLLRQGMV